MSEKKIVPSNSSAETPRGPIVTFGLLFAALGIVAATAFLTDQDFAYRWLKEWQTLLTGVMAIAAAVLSIHQIHKSDALQERRHREILGLNLRPDTLRLGRFVHQSEREIAQALHDVSTILATILENRLFKNEISDRDKIAELDTRNAVMTNELIKSVSVLFDLSKADNFSVVSDLMDPGFLDLLRKAELSRNAFAWAMNGQEAAYLRRIGDFSLPEEIGVGLANMDREDMKRLEKRYEAFGNDLYNVSKKIEGVYRLYQSKGLVFEEK